MNSSKPYEGIVWKFWWACLSCLLGGIPCSDTKFRTASVLTYYIGYMIIPAPAPHLPVSASHLKPSARSYWGGKRSGQWRHRMQPLRLARMLGDSSALEGIFPLVSDLMIWPWDASLRFSCRPPTKRVGDNLKNTVGVFMEISNIHGTFLLWASKNSVGKVAMAQI